MKSDKELLMEIEGIGEHKADNLLHHFGSGKEVANAACRYWGEIEKVPNFSEEEAKNMFDKMGNAGVFHKLRGY